MEKLKSQVQKLMVEINFQKPLTYCKSRIRLYQTVLEMFVGKGDHTTTRTSTSTDINYITVIMEYHYYYSYSHW